MGTVRTMELKKRPLNVIGSFMHADGVVLAAYTLDKKLLDVSVPIKTTVGTSTSFEMQLKTRKVSVVRDFTGLRTAIWFDFVCQFADTGTWVFTLPCVWSSEDNIFSMKDIDMGLEGAGLCQLFTEMGLNSPDNASACEEVFLRHVDECLRKLVAFAHHSRMGVTVEEIVVADTEWSLLD